MSCDNVNVDYSITEPYFVSVARGLVPNSTNVSIFGYGSSVSGSYVTLWENNSIYVYPTSATTMTIASSSSTDNSASTVTLTGLSSTWDPISEVIALNGTVNVTTTNSYLRINSFTMLTPAAGQTSNVGTITAKAGGTTYAQIAPTFGKMQNGFYSVANGYSLYILNLVVTTGDGVNHGNTQVYAGFRALSTNNNVSPALKYILAQVTFQGNYTIAREVPVVYASKSDIQWEGFINTGSAAISVIVQGVLIKN
jgi:hypothetical protein